MYNMQYMYYNSSKPTALMFNMIGETTVILKLNHKFSVGFKSGDWDDLIEVSWLYDYMFDASVLLKDLSIVVS